MTERTQIAVSEDAVHADSGHVIDDHGLPGNFEHIRLMQE
jgi:hypothetical protein